LSRCGAYRCGYLAQGGEIEFGTFRAIKTTAEMAHIVENVTNENRVTDSSQSGQIGCVNRRNYVNLQLKHATTVAGCDQLIADFVCQ